MVYKLQKSLKFRELVSSTLAHKRHKNL